MVMITPSILNNTCISSVSCMVKQLLLEDLEGKIEALTAKLYEEGIDLSVVSQLMHEKEEGEAKVEKLYKEVRTILYKGSML